MSSRKALDASPARTLSFRDQLICRAVEQWADSEPESTCIVQDDGLTVTYEELDLRASAIARGLRDQGVGVGDRVITLVANDVRAVYIALAIAKLGAIEVPMNPALTGASLRHPLADAAPTVAVVAPEYHDAVLDAWPSQTSPTLVSAAAEGTTPAAGGWPALDEFLASVDSRLRTAAEVDSTMPSAILYTSGTTGLPKGALMSHRHCFNISKVVSEALALSRSDRYIGAQPLFHGGGRLNHVGASLLAGTPCLLVRRFSASSFMNVARDLEATIMLGVVTMAHFLLAQEPTAADRDTTLSRAFIVPCPPLIKQVFAERFGIDAFEAYGCTEAGMVLWNTNGPVSSCGRPVQPYRVRILDEFDRQAPVGHVGEIAVASDEPWTTFSGYWGQPDATLRATRNFWLHTGDAGYVDDNGDFWFVDRVKDMIRRRGENVSAQTIEDAVNAMDGVIESAAYAVPSQFGEDEIAVAVVVRPVASVAPDDIFDHCEHELPKFAVPRYIRLVDALPKTTNEKVRKAELRNHGVAGAFERVPTPRR